MRERLKLKYAFLFLSSLFIGVLCNKELMAVDIVEDYFGVEEEDFVDIEEPWQRNIPKSLLDLGKKFSDKGIDQIRFLKGFVIFKSLLEYAQEGGDFKLSEQVLKCMFTKDRKSESMSNLAHFLYALAAENDQAMTKGAFSFQFKNDVNEKIFNFLSQYGQPEDPPSQMKKYYNSFEDSEIKQLKNSVKKIYLNNLPSLTEQEKGKVVLGLYQVPSSGKDTKFLFLNFKPKARIIDYLPGIDLFDPEDMRDRTLRVPKGALSIFNTSLDYFKDLDSEDRDAYSKLAEKRGIGYMLKALNELSENYEKIPYRTWSTVLKQLFLDEMERYHATLNQSELSQVFDSYLDQERIGDIYYPYNRIGREIIINNAVLRKFHFPDLNTIKDNVKKLLKEYGC